MYYCKAFASPILRKCECDFNLYDTDFYKKIQIKLVSTYHGKNSPVDNLCDQPHKNNLKKHP